MAFVKQILVIGSEGNSIETELGSDFGFGGDLDKIGMDMSFNLPYVKFNEDASGVDLTRLKKFDTAKLYYGEFETNPGDIGLSNLNLVFDGFIDNITLSKSKDSISYAISCFSTILLPRKLERTTEEVKYVEDAINTLLQLGGVQDGEAAVLATIDLFPPSMIRYIDIDAQDLLVKLSGDEELVGALKKITQNYAINIYQSGDGYLNIVTPTQILQSGGDLAFNAWEFKIDENMWSLDYGNIVNDINGVVCLGRPPDVMGQAIDPIGVQLNAGSGVTPGPQHYNYLTIQRRDLIDTESCQKVARNELLNILKNYVVTFTTKFDYRYRLGQPVTIYDNDRYPDGKIFFIKSYRVSLSKDSVVCTIVAYASSITQLPEDLVIDSDGITDVDNLDITYETQNTIGWGDGGFE